MKYERLARGSQLRLDTGRQPCGPTAAPAKLYRTLVEWRDRLEKIAVLYHRVLEDH
jgi:hypothetical protein